MQTDFQNFQTYSRLEANTIMTQKKTGKMLINSAVIEVVIA